MGYQIEISCGLQIPSFQKTAIIEKAKFWNCELHYTQYELEGRRRQIYHQKCVMTFVFPETDFEQHATQDLSAEVTHPFVRYIRARRGIYIECISYICTHHVTLIMYNLYLRYHVHDRCYIHGTRYVYMISSIYCVYI